MEIHNHRTRPRHESGREGRVSCLKCDQMFDSEDRTRFRICSKCKRSSVYKNSRDHESIFLRSGNVMRVPTDTKAGKKRARTSPYVRSTHSRNTQKRN